MHPAHRVLRVYSVKAVEEFPTYSAFIRRYFHENRKYFFTVPTVMKETLCSEGLCTCFWGTEDLASRTMTASGEYFKAISRCLGITERQNTNISKTLKGFKGIQTAPKISVSKNTDTNPSVHFQKTEHGVRLSWFNLFGTNHKYHTQFYAMSANFFVPSETLANGTHTQCSNMQTAARGPSSVVERSLRTPLFHIPFFTDCNACFKMPSTVTSSGNASLTFSVNASACFGA